MNSERNPVVYFQKYKRACRTHFLFICYVKLLSWCQKHCNQREVNDSMVITIGDENMFADKQKVLELRRRYPNGTRVKLVEMDDEQAPPIGTKGTVYGIDDIGSLLVHWDNGSSLHVLYGIDSCVKVDEP